MLDTEKPLVSIAIVTYNQKEFLKECIESCLAQDYPNLEIVVADDGSSDGTHELLNDYDMNYPGKFVLRLSKENQGITNNSNAAHFACSGKYIAWMGGDDLMLPGKISKQVSFMEKNPNCSICYHNLDVFDSDTNRTIKFFNQNRKISGDIVKVIRYGTFNGACSNLVRADKAPKHGFDVTIPVASDWLYWVETLGNGGTINYIDEVLGRYRRHGENVTNTKAHVTQNELDHLLACQIIIAKYPHYFSYAIEAYSNKLISLRKKLNYFSCLWKSFCLSPSIKAVGGICVFLCTFGMLKL